MTYKDDSAIDMDLTDYVQKIKEEYKLTDKIKFIIMLLVITQACAMSPAYANKVHELLKPAIETITNIIVEEEKTKTNTDADTNADQSL